MERTDIIKQKLNEIGEDFDALKPFLIDYLEKIEDYIQTKEKMQTEGIKTIKDASFSISSISKELGCSRTTLYNHNSLLKRYIEYSIELFNKENPFIAYENLKNTKTELEKEIDLMEIRDINFELLKHENSMLQSTLKEKNQQIERLESRVHELSGKLHNLELEKNKYSNNVSDFKKKNS